MINENTTSNTDPDTLIDAGSNSVIDGAVTVVKEIDNSLVITNPDKYAQDLFEPFHVELTAAKRRASRANYDITTPAGMEAAKMLSDTFVKIRTRADKLKTERKKPIDQAGKALLERFRALADAAKAEQDKHDAAINNEKARLEQIEEDKRQAERARIEAIEARLAHIRGIPGRAAKADSTALQAQIDELLAKQLDPALYEAFLEQAAEAMLETTDQLRDLLEEALLREAEERRIAAQAEELARLKADREAAEQRQREEAAERERTAQAERDKAASEKADLERQLAEMKAAFAALQPKAEPVPEAVPVVAGVDLAAPEADQTVEHDVQLEAAAGATPIEERKPINPQGQYYSTTTFKDNGEPILCNADGTRSIFCDVADDNPLVFSYNAATDVLTVEGIHYAGDIFRQLGTLEAGQLFRLVANENGVLVVLKA